MQAKANWNPATNQLAETPFSVVLPATGKHAWDITEGWIRALQRMGLLIRCFRPRGNWGDCRLKDDDGLLAYLSGNPQEYFLLLGLDWHSQPMHYDECAELLALRHHLNVSVIWEDYASEYALKSGLQKEMLDAFYRSKHLARTIFTHHYSNIEILKNFDGAIDIHYVPFGVDVERYKHLRNEGPSPTAEKTPFFSGKITDWETADSDGPYAMRKKLITHLTNVFPGIRTHSGGLTENEYVRSLLDHQVCINFPSFSLSPTLRNYEIIASGGCLVTWEKPIYHPTDFYSFENIYTYNPHKPSTLELAIKNAQKNAKTTSKAQYGKKRTKTIAKESHSRKGLDQFR